MSACSEPSPPGVEAPTAFVRYLVVDCLDLDRSARFWGALLGLRPERRIGDYLFMGSVLPRCDLVLQPVDRVTADKSPVHFDIQGAVRRTLKRSLPKRNGLVAESWRR